MPRPAEPGIPAAFKQPVRYLKGVGPARETLLNRLSIFTVGDLLLCLPREYRTYRVSAVADAREGASVVLSVMLKELKMRPLRRSQMMVSAVAADSTGSLRIHWFNQPYVAERLSSGMWLLVEGRVRRSKYGLYLEPERFEEISEEEGGFLLGRSQHEVIRVQYALSEGLTQRAMRALAKQALDKVLPALGDPLPRQLLEKHGLPALPEAFRRVHQPAVREEAESGRRRLAYDELLLFEAALMLRRQSLKQMAAAYRIEASPKVDERIRRRIPFRLTAAQERVIAEIRRDLAAAAPMNRLLQGDVGAGKTIVAFYAILACVARRLQTVLLAPTEILAEQHYSLFRSLLEGSQVSIALLTGSVRGERRRQILESVKSGAVHVLVGTHAVLEGGVEPARLALVVMDEQHRFGVLQRQRLRSKASGVHTLLMTATPIPRTLALTLYGDLDVSVLDELPPGRGSVTTRAVPARKVAETWRFVRERALEGERAYVICPLIEESEKSDLVAAEALYQELSRGPLAGVGVGLLHGRMSWRQKEQTLGALRKGELKVLVSTVVVEVGIDVPEATVMVVQRAERFGLSQLHQLRGRIGRSSRASWFWMVVAGGGEALERVRVLERTRDGFEVAEADFRLRGPGEFFGVRQHGRGEFVIADLLRDFALLAAAREDARALVESDPRLARPEHAALRRRIMEVFSGRMSLVEVG